MSLNYQCPNCGTSLGYKGLCWKCRAEQERKEVLSWSEEQIAEKTAHLIAHADQLDNWDSAEYQEAHKLQEFLGVCPPELQRAAAEAGVTCFEQLYDHAPADVRDLLIKRLMETEDAHEAGKLMSCLAMQGDDESLAALLELERNPRPWRKKLYVDPSVYAECGGWTFDKNGQRITLNYDTCFAMEKGKKNEDKAALIGRPREDICPHCGGKLVDILVLDGRDERLRFLGVDGILTATCCPNCCAFSEAVFSRFTLDGGSTPLFPYADTADKMENYMDEESYQELTSNTYGLGKSPVPVFYGAGSEDINTIGGFASWIQDWQYTSCPDCGRKMKYIAQIQWDTVIDCSEGTFYIELCPDCRVVSMHHQQT